MCPLLILHVTDSSLYTCQNIGQLAAMLQGNPPFIQNPQVCADTDTLLCSQSKGLPIHVNARDQADRSILAVHVHKLLALSNIAGCDGVSVCDQCMRWCMCVCLCLCLQGRRIITMRECLNDEDQEESIDIV